MFVISVAVSYIMFYEFVVSSGGIVSGVVNSLR